MKRDPRRLRRADLLLVAAAIAAAFGVTTAIVSSGARSASLDDRARGVEVQLRCPTCQGLSIADSPAKAAAQMRDVIRDQIGTGASDDDVRAYFVKRYGRWILLEPPASGVDLLLWLLPPTIIGLGALLIVRGSRRRPVPRMTTDWSVASSGSASRRSVVLIGLAMAFAMVAPVVAASGSRTPGGQVSGGTTPAGAPSIQDLEAFVRMQPRDLESLLALGDALLEAGRLDEAATRYRAVLEIDAGSVPAQLGLASIVLMSGRPDVAGALYDRVLDVSPDVPEALLGRAVARLKIAGSGTASVRRDLERFLSVTALDDPRRPLAEDLLRGLVAPHPDASASPE